MPFGWHPVKRASNIEKHGIDFVDILPTFDDPARDVRRDARFDYGETRFNMIARLDGRTLHVTFTVRGDVVWIISARVANAKEKRRYVGD